jgi:hypothetical protein
LSWLTTRKMPIFSTLSRKNQRNSTRFDSSLRFLSVKEES